MDALGRLVLSEFPSRHFVYCFAYGSGVFRQAGREADAAPAMVDMIFAVDDTPGFHRDNAARNPGHYSRLRHLGAAAVSAVQTRAGARVYFNTHVTVGGALCKYGVIDARDFARDLRAWTTLYTAGRLHKPVRVLVDRARGCGGGGGCGPLVARNLESAARAALLLLPERFAERELYEQIAGLSYRGDFRMIVGEDRRKVSNIVRPQADAFRRLYAPALRAVRDAGLLSAGPAADSVAEQDASARARLHHLRRLPANMRRVLTGGGGADFDRDDDGDGDDGPATEAEAAALEELAGRRDLPRIVRDALWRIVFRPSLVQSVKGIPTAGLRNSVAYSYGKLSKMVRSMWS